MLDRLGGEARRVMADAEAHARNLGSPVVGCAHLLLALVDDGLGGPALDDANVTFADLRGALVATADQTGTSSGRGGRLPYAGPLLEVLRSAWRRSVTEKGSTTGPSHLLAAIVDDRPTDVVRLLASVGVALEDLSVDRVVASRRRTIPFRPFAGSAAPADWDDDDRDDADIGVSRGRHPSTGATAASATGGRSLRSVQGGLDLRNRPTAIDLVCPRCDDDLDPVIVELAVDGRPVEALACPACRSLITAWPA
jgi:ATP-dependent Clp protease ATP-binding subunit ClpA